MKPLDIETTGKKVKATTTPDGVVYHLDLETITGTGQLSISDDEATALLAVLIYRRAENGDPLSKLLVNGIVESVQKCIREAKASAN